MIVESKQDMKTFARTPPKMTQNWRLLIPLLYGVFDSSSSSSAILPPSSKSLPRLASEPRRLPGTLTLLLPEYLSLLELLNMAESTEAGSMPSPTPPPDIVRSSAPYAASSSSSVERSLSGIVSFTRRPGVRFGISFTALNSGVSSDGSRDCFFGLP